MATQASTVDRQLELSADTSLPDNQTYYHTPSELSEAVKSGSDNNSAIDWDHNDQEHSPVRSNNVLDKINKDVKTERKQRYRKVIQSHVPEVLHGEGKKEEEVMQLVDQLVFYEDANGEEVQINDSAQQADLDDTGKLTITAHSLAAHFTTLETSALERAASKLESDCKLWLSRLFRFKNAVPAYHEKRYEALARIGRLALYTKYPKYATEGFEALYSRPPVIYISAAAPPGLGQYLCQQLGLPLSCSCVVPCNTLFGASSKMDVALLENLIQDDLAAAKTPVLLVAYAGTPVVGHVDNLQRLQEISKANNIWLHVDGNSLSTLTIFSVPTSIESAITGDSITLDLTNWLGVPSLSYVTLVKECSPSLTEAAGLTTVDPKLQLKCLPLWMCLQSLGHEGTVSRIKHSCELAKTLYDHLDKIDNVKQISRDKQKQDKEMKNIKEAFSKSVNALLVFEIVTPTVVFRYMGDGANSNSLVVQYSTITTDESKDDREELFFDALNTWLAESLQASSPRVPIDLVEVDKEGICLRYSPLESAQVRGTTKEDVEEFVSSLQSNLSVLNATTLQQKKFRAIVSSHTNLRMVELDCWAGLGAVSYVPDIYLSKEEHLTDKEKIEINNLNAELVHKLKAQDTAFSTGHTDDGVMCVRFGLITSETNVDDLVSLVYSTGKEVEESSKFLESMSDLIRRGIEEANKELEKENNEKLLYEGVLRQVPVVSSLLNWFSPMKDHIKGRTFNLTSGKIIPTTDTYKYHMQIQEDDSATRLSRSPRDKVQTNGQNSVQRKSFSNDVSELPVSSTVDKTAGEVKAKLASEAVTATSSVTATTPPASPKLNQAETGSEQTQRNLVNEEARNATVESNSDSPAS